MSDINKWIPEKLVKKVYNRIEKIANSRNKIEPEDIEKVSPLFKAHFAEQIELPVEDRTVFMDEWGGSIMLLKTPKSLENVKATKSKNYLIYVVSPMLEKEIKAFVPSLDGLADLRAIFRGRLKTQYKTIGADYKYAIPLAKFLKEWECEKLDEIDPSEYLVDYTLNIWQAIAVIE